ncbi:MAG: endonuclease III domain-containing protein [Acidobacteria bacterium]|nr:endonuclease III domain-containing protein [Acidobacteriota bacterium]
MKPSERVRRKSGKARELEKYFHALHLHFGPQHWWPAKTRLEVILGAILTQNTSWRNAALALRELRLAGLLRYTSLKHLPAKKLAPYVRSAGFFRQKARAIRNFLDWLEQQCGGSLHRLFSLPPEEARNRLLRIKGLGPETVDAILLYAGRHAFFVADSYTRRVLIRHRLIPQNSGYNATQVFMHQHLESSHVLYNEFHALLVKVGKRYCVKSTPKCSNCPLRPFLPPSGPA